MIPKYRAKLFALLFLFAMIVSFVVATIDYNRAKQQTITENENKLEYVTKSVTYALQISDKAFYFLDKEIANKMEKGMHLLHEKYAQNEIVASWDYEQLARDLQMDVYVLNDKNKVIHSNVPYGEELDFSLCCKDFSRMLDKRRRSGDIYIDGIDLDIRTREPKKYIYQASVDKKYMFELGLSLQGDPIFNEFNFIQTINDLTESLDSVETIRILNYGGISFGIDQAESLDKDRRQAFEHARATGNPVEISSVSHDKEVRYRYIPYESMYDDSSTKLKVIELKYISTELAAHLQKTYDRYIVQLMLVLVATIIASFIIANWFARPIYLAFHDSLTGLKNRAAFSDILDKALSTNDRGPALIMMDLDNFKLVNDYLGHSKGDYLLQVIASSIKQAVNDEHEVFRLGGDEFATIVTVADEEKAVAVARVIIETIDRRLKQEKEISLLSVTISVGIALATSDDTESTLFKKADIALYESKEKGKSQYQVYVETGKEPKIPFLTRKKE